MPSADAGDLAQTLVCLAWQLGCAPSLGDTSESVTLGNTNDVEQFILSENLGDSDLLLEAIDGPLDLVSSRSSAVDLNLSDVTLLLAKTKLVDLGVHNGAHDLAVLVDLVDLGIASLLALLSTEAGSVVGESTGLLVEVLDESALDSL